jgi:NAD(P)H-hydrate epimerase
MREWEQATWALGKAQSEVIEQAGRRVGLRAQQMTRHGDRVLVLAGKGHNGDDARKCASHLTERRVCVRNITDPEKDLPELLPLLEERPALVVDGLFGIGLNRPLDAAWAGLINRINEFGVNVLSVDVPSGLNADTGEPEGAAIRATVTITLGSPKRGLLQARAWEYVGKLELVGEIGLTDCPHASELNWILPGDFQYYPPPRPVAAHKGDFGRLAIIAGSPGYHGAAVLAARGAQRAQPGLITLLTMDAVYTPVASQLQAVMVNVWKPDAKLPGDFNAILIGPGLAAPSVPDVLKSAARKLWEQAPVPVIVDASALDWLPKPGKARLPENAIRVVTPHPGEAARLLDITSMDVQASRVEALRELSQRLGNCWVVLKGHQTLIGRNNGGILVNSSGNPQLAQGGSGDVLAGYLAGLLAQPALQADPMWTIACGVWRHGDAADRLSPVRANWVVEELAAEIGHADAESTSVSG